MKRSASVSLPAIDCVRRPTVFSYANFTPYSTVRLMPMTHETKLYGQLNSSPLLFVERKEIAAPETPDRGHERKVRLPSTACEKVAKLVVAVDLRPLRERQIGLLFSSAVVGRMLRRDALPFGVRNLRMRLGSCRGRSRGNGLIAIAVKPDGRDDRLTQKRENECADGCRKTQKKTAQYLHVWPNATRKGACREQRSM